MSVSIHRSFPQLLRLFSACSSTLFTAPLSHKKELRHEAKASFASARRQCKSSCPSKPFGHRETEDWEQALPYTGSQTTSADYLGECYLGRQNCTRDQSKTCTIQAWVQFLAIFWHCSIYYYIFSLQIL